MTKKLPWFERVANWCRKRGHTYVILDREGKKPYLERFYIHPRWLTLGLFRVVIHRFWKSDDDGGLHDHPWLFWGSRILKGGYFEHTPEGRFWRAPGKWRFNTAWALHRVELQQEGKEVWTLFLMGPKIREWGFVPFKSKVWINWKEYLEQKLVTSKKKKKKVVVAKPKGKKPVKGKQVRIVVNRPKKKSKPITVNTRRVASRKGAKVAIKLVKK